MRREPFQRDAVRSPRPPASVSVLDRSSPRGPTRPAAGRAALAPTAASRPAGPRLDAAIREYTRYLETRGGSSRSDFARHCVCRWVERWPRASLHEISPTDANLYLASRLAGGAKTTEVSRESRLLSHFFTWAKRQGGGIRTPRRSRARPRAAACAPPVAWTFSEQRRLLDACRHKLQLSDARGAPILRHHPAPYLRSIVLLGLQTGLRLENLLGLEWRHVDLLTETLWIPPAETRRGEGLFVCLPRESARLLRSLWEALRVLPQRPPQVFAAQGLPEAYGKPNRAEVLERFREAVARADVRPGGFDSLRWSFAYNCVQSGVSFLKAAILVDWDDIGVLVDLYHRCGQRGVRRTSPPLLLPASALAGPRSRSSLLRGSSLRASSPRGTPGAARLLSRRLTPRPSAS
ncbi:MAG: site-specific integrase [Planctomycetes bacterium]|nr:site-specific integrase [Planctomycetota bacterium]